MGFARPLAFALLILACGVPARTQRKGAPERPTPRGSGTTLPVWFEPNSAGTGFVASRGDASLALDEAGARFTVRGAAIDLHVANARQVVPVAESPLVTRVSYYTGSDPKAWRSGVPTFGRVVYPGVRDGVDLVFHGEAGEIEYDFVVAPGTDPAAIEVEVAGAESLALDAAGDLTIHTPAGDIVQPRPRVYQRSADGREHDVAASYRISGDRRVAFALASYDRERELVIDPVLAFATVVERSGLGGAVDTALDREGNVYVAGTQVESAVSPTGSDTLHAYVVKLDPSGQTALFVTHFVGSMEDRATTIVVDASSNVHIAGTTTSMNFPTSNAVGPSHTGPTTAWTKDAFVATLDATGALVHSTYLGGTSDEVTRDLAVDGSGCLYVVGSTSSANFPVTASAFRSSRTGPSDGFVAKIDFSVPALVFATYLGGGSDDEVNAVTIDGEGRAVVVGQTWSPDFPVHAALQAAERGPADAFITRFTADGAALVHSTFLGGQGIDGASAVTLDAAGALYVTGTTRSLDFPTKGGAPSKSGAYADAFVGKLTPDGSSLDYATCLGGSRDEAASAIAVDPDGAATIAGVTTSTDLPVVAALQEANTGAANSAGNPSGLLATLLPDGSAFSFVSYFGSDGTNLSGVALGAAGEIFAAGKIYTGDMPLGSLPHTGRVGHFVLKIDPAPAFITPAWARTYPRGQQTFVARGVPLPCTFSLAVNTSGATIDPLTGVYTAGPIGLAADVVRVTDAEGGEWTANVAVSRAMSNNTMKARPLDSLSLYGDGGSGEYTWAVVAAPSGGHLVASAGRYPTYNAGPVADVVDEVEITDSVGSKARVRINIGARLTLAPVETLVFPGDSTTLYASGGTRSAKRWSLVSNSGGSLGDDPSHMLFHAGHRGDVTDTVAVTDDAGVIASVDIRIAPSLSVLPAAPRVLPRGTISFATVGGHGTERKWMFVTNETGATIDSKGHYRAGKSGGRDELEARDDYANTARVTVVVTRDATGTADAQGGSDAQGSKTGAGAASAKRPGDTAGESSSCTISARTIPGSRGPACALLVAAAVLAARLRARAGRSGARSRSPR